MIAKVIIAKIGILTINILFLDYGIKHL